jgi:hypothetical protein
VVGRGREWGAGSIGKFEGCGLRRVDEGVKIGECVREMRSEELVLACVLLLLLSPNNALRLLFLRLYLRRKDCPCRCSRAMASIHLDCFRNMYKSSPPIC